VPRVFVSAKDGTGLEALREAIAEIARKHTGPGAPAFTLPDGSKLSDIENPADSAGAAAECGDNAPGDGAGDPRLGTHAV